MLWFLDLSVSKALRNDQWPMLEEIRAFTNGRVGWSYLWPPYWGHRIVVPRLILLADERWFRYANAPLCLINLLALFGCAAILMISAWRLRRSFISSFDILSLTVIPGLVLSSIQLENIVYGMAVQYTIAFVSAIACFALLAHRRLNVLTLASAIACTLCFGTGLLLSPVLLVEAVLLGKKPKLLATIAATGALTAFVYLREYSNVAMGMGVIGALRRPIHAAWIAALVLGGPLTNVRIWAGTTVGAFGLLLTGYLVVRAFLQRAIWPPESATLLSVLLFMAGSAFSVAVARISPEWLVQHPRPLPGRYLTFAFLFWAAALPLALFDLKQGGTPIAAAGTVLVTLTLLLGFIPAQLDASEQWLRTYRAIDAAASGFFVGAYDQTYMAQMYPDDATLARDVPYLREHGLSVFAEPRAKWVRQKLTEAFQVDTLAKCAGIIEVAQQTNPGVLRLTGYVTGPHVSRFAKTDLVFTDAAGRIKGLGRTLMEEEQRGERFLAYAEGTNDNLTGWLVGPNLAVCRLN